MKKFYKWFTSGILMLYLYSYNSIAYAGELESSKLVEGVKELIKDATTVLMGVSGGIAVLMVIAALIQKMMTRDEMDHKRMNGTIKTVLLCAIGVFSASAIIKIAESYFK